MDENRTLWNKCARLHGHECGGLTIGYKAAMYAIRLLKLDGAEDDQIVCICESKSCAVDAFRAIFGCSGEKGTLLLHPTGLSAFSVYNRRSNTAIRLVLKPTPEGMTREKSFDYYQSLDPAEMFDVEPAGGVLPCTPNAH